uniref:Uncharacterized protein n=1 Tax=Opuntia streptacantha TaxID=393608 RepID=A0A7C9DVN1_OPUST
MCRRTQVAVDFLTSISIFSFFLILKSKEFYFTSKNMTVQEQSIAQNCSEQMNSHIQPVTVRYTIRFSSQAHNCRPSSCNAYPLHMNQLYTLLIIWYRLIF